jgi:hypothetical protein
LILIETPSRDARLAEILRDPDRYFAEASVRAWIAAKAEVDADLAERTRRRRNHDPTRQSYLPAWLPATTDLPQHH